MVWSTPKQINLAFCDLESCQYAHANCGLADATDRKPGRFGERKENQLELSRARLATVQADQSSHDSALSTLETALADKEKQIQKLKDQRDRLEKDKQEETDLHQHELREYKLKIDSLEKEIELKQVRSIHAWLAPINKCRPKRP